MTGYYRFYRFDRLGHVVDYKVLTCPSDAEAIELAEQSAGRERQELWSGARLLVTVEAKHAA